MRARAAVCLAVAAMLLAAVGPPPAGPEEAAVQPPGQTRVAGRVWTAGTASGKTSLWTHTNQWTCHALPCRDTEIGTATAAGQTETSDCELRAATAGAVNPRGCGSHGNRGRWRWTAHVAPTGTEVANSAQWNCAGGDSDVVATAAACGTWTDCGPEEIPNTAGT